jgi:hypothetical protein
MKTLVYQLERLILAVGLILISIPGISQETKLTRQEQKEAKRDKQFLNFQVLDTLLKNRSFVLEADFLENQYGYRKHVMSNINFIMVDSLKAVLQTGSNNNFGFNGVGGTTAEGNISGLKIVKNEKNLSFFLSFTVNSNIGIYDVSMNISCNNTATATITGLTRGKLVYDGRIQTLYNSGVYKGRNSI